MGIFRENKKLTVINFFAGPGVGKSTVATELFALMKREQFSVEFVDEVAKGLTYDNAHNLLSQQDYVSACQHRNQRRLLNHGVKFCVTDTSLALGVVYCDPSYPTSFLEYVIDLYNSFNNINVLLLRDVNIPYQQHGRLQTLDQAKQVDLLVSQLVDDVCDPTQTIRVISANSAATEILNFIKQVQFCI